MEPDNEKYDVKGLEYGFLIFGFAVSVFSIFSTITDGFDFLFAVNPKGSRLMGVPGILILFIGLVMFYFPLRKILLSKKKNK